MSAAAIAAEMQALVRDAALPGEPGESVKAAIRRAARRLAITHSQARRLWYGQRAAILAHEAEALRARARSALSAIEADTDRRMTALRARVGVCGGAR
jgi:hypothetical protein